MNTPTPAVKLDPRLTHAGMSITVRDLIRLWADHTPPIRPARSRCRCCGHHYTDLAPLCPTAAVVRPLLRKRRHEAASQVLDLLTTNQLDDLLAARPAKLSTYFRSSEDFR